MNNSVSDPGLVLLLVARFRATTWVRPLAAWAKQCQSSVASRLLRRAKREPAICGIRYSPSPCLLPKPSHRNAFLGMGRRIKGEGTFERDTLARRSSAKPLGLGLVGLLLLTLSTPGATFRYANSANRIYIENGGAATLTAIQTALPNAPLQLVDATNQIWLLRANLFIADGSTLMLHGAGAGGDVNELRLLSNNSTGSNSVVNVDADSGALDLDSVRVTSWNEASGGPDTEYEAFGRAFIRARSRQVGTILQQSTLNVRNSDIGYLGVDDSLSYGLTWQVVSSAAGARVFGDVRSSYIHDCQLGVSTWSVDDVSWVDNEIAYNTLYGFDFADPAHLSALADNNVHDNEYRANVRWSSSSQVIYVSGPGSSTLSEIKAAAPGAPLLLVDAASKTWYLGSRMVLQYGA